MKAEHEHCWHELNQNETTAGTVINSRCCHCGNLRQITIPPFDKAIYEYKPNEHGPFAPDNTPRWTQ